MKILSQITTSTPVNFVNWTQQQLQIELNQIQLVESLSNKQLILLRATAQPAVMGKLFEEQWFHYDDYIMLHDISFNEQQPIEITMVLAHSIADRFIEANVELDQILFSLIDIEEKAFAAINHAEYWFITDATQAIELPPALAEQEGSSLKQGFKTVWHNELLQQPLHDRKIQLTEFSSLTLTEQVIQTLEANAYTWEYFNGEIIKVFYPQSNYSWAELIRVDEVNRVILFYAVFQKQLTDELITKLSYILLNENYNMTDGAFELDLDDGELRYRSTLFANENVQSSAMTKILLQHKSVMELYIPAIEKYVDSN